MARRILCVGAIWLFAGTVSAQTRDVRYPLQLTVSPPVREMPPQPHPPREPKEIPFHRLHHAAAGNVTDPVVQTTQAIATTQTQGQWEGLGGGYPGYAITAVPPDPNIAVGPNHIVQWVNNAFVVFDKQGTQIQAPIDDGTFWESATCNQLGGFSDPIVQYDRMADRWLIGEVGIPLLPGLFGQYAQCFAVSTTSDPTGSYYMWGYGFGTNINDYPKISVWPDGYYVTWNIFDAGGNFVGPEVCAFDRSAMLIGVHAPALVCFKLGGAFASLLTSDLDGATLPPAGSPNFVMNIDPVSGVTNLWKFHVDFVNTNNSTLVGPTAIASAAPFTAPCPTTQDCIPQPGTTTMLDAIGDRLMYRLAYRNFGDHASIVANHTVLTPGGNTAVRWYEVRDPNGTPIVYQQGTFAPDTDNRWMGSIAMDQRGNIGVGYSVGSGTTYPSIRFTGWEVGNALGQLQAETFAVIGSGSQTGYDRWGDYSAMRIDPTDDCTFWYTQEYQAVTDTANWNTRIISFRFPSCAHASLAPTTTALTSSLNPSTYGSSVAFTAVVSPTSGTGTPTGTVMFVDGTTTLGSSAVDASGTATLSTASLTAGSHSIVAQYGGDSAYAGSSSSALSQTVNQANTTTSLTSSPNPSGLGGSVLFTAVVAPSSGTGTPTGTVTFDDGVTVLGSSAVGVGGVATFSTASLAVGAHSIVAQYGGDPAYTGSSSPALSQTVNPANSVTTLTSLPNPSTCGGSVVFTAAVAPSSGPGTPTGTVTFVDGATLLGSSAVGAGGVATFATASLSVGTHSIVAQYSGDSVYTGSSSAALLQTVDKANTATTLSSSLNPSTYGASVVLIGVVTASSGTGTPTGTVTFVDGATVLGSAAVNASGVATLTTTTLAAGTHSIVATYGGNAVYVGSSSAALTQTVNKADTTTTLTSNRNPSTPSQPATFKATLSSSTATGAVQFYDGAVLLGTSPVSNGIATLTPSLAVGSHTITAQYSGDVNYNGSTSAVLNQTVRRRK